MLYGIDKRLSAIMNTRLLLLRFALLAIPFNTTIAQAAAPLATPGLWQITIVDFADRTSVAEECVKKPDWGWLIVYAGKTASDESCKLPVATVDGNVVAIIQICKSVKAEMLVSQPADGKLAGSLTTSSLTPYGIAIPFHSKFQAQRLSADCP